MGYYQPFESKNMKTLNYLRHLVKSKGLKCDKKNSENHNFLDLYVNIYNFIKFDSYSDITIIVFFHLSCKFLFVNIPNLVQSIILCCKVTPKS